MQRKQRSKKSADAKTVENGPSLSAPSGLSAQNIRMLSHELQVHQEELEIQNRQLSESQHLLEKSCDRYANLFDFAPVAYVTLDTHGVIRNINLTGADFLGYPRDRLIDRPFVLFVAPQYRRPFLGHLLRCRESFSQLGCELLLERRGGPPAAVELRTSGRPLEDGDRVVYLSALIDLTDRHRLDQERDELHDVSRSEMLMRTILESLPVAVRVVDANGEALLFNDACRLIWGIPRGAPLPSWRDQKAWEPGGGKHLPADQWPVARALRNQGLLRKTIQIQAYDGQHRVVMQSAVPLLDDGGAVSGAVEVTEDLTRLLEAQESAHQRQEKLEAAFDAAHLSFWDWDLKSNQVTWSGPFERFVAPHPADSSQPIAFMQHVHPDDTVAFQDAIEQARELRRTLEQEFRIVMPAGAVRWLSAKGRFFYDGEGKPMRMSGVVTDITARKIAEEQLVSAKETAEEASRLKDDFLATISHELRTPLSAIFLWAHLARTSLKSDEERNQALETIIENSKAQTQIVDDLLDISRGIAGKLRLNLETATMAPAVNAAIEAVRPSAEMRQIELHVQIDPTLPQVQLDSSRIRQVAWNLLSNAIKFTPRGGSVTTTLTVHHESDKPPAARLTITDSGQGIAPDFLPYVFDRFRQADSSSTRPHGGLGLGLAITRELVQMHGGTVRASSEGLNRGASFTVDLPLPTDYVMAQAPVEPIAASNDSLEGIDVLLVEDDDTTRDALERVLESAGAHVRAVASAQFAIDAFRRASPDVLISDIAMPMQDGYSLLRALRALESSRKKVKSGQTSPPKSAQTPAVALTALARANDRARAIDAGFQAHLSKPVNPRELISTIAALFQSSKTAG